MLVPHFLKIYFGLGYIRYNKYEKFIKFIKSHKNKQKQNHFLLGYSDEKMKQTQIMKCIKDNVKNLTN